MSKKDFSTCPSLFINDMENLWINTSGLNALKLKQQNSFYIKKQSTNLIEKKNQPDIQEELLTDSEKELPKNIISLGNNVTHPLELVCKREITKRKGVVECWKFSTKLVLISSNYSVQCPEMGLSTIRILGNQKCIKGDFQIPDQGILTFVIQFEWTDKVNRNRRFRAHCLDWQILKDESMDYHYFLEGFILWKPKFKLSYVQKPITVYNNKLNKIEQVSNSRETSLDKRKSNPIKYRFVTPATSHTIQETSASKRVGIDCTKIDGISFRFKENQNPKKIVDDTSVKLPDVEGNSSPKPVSTDEEADVPGMVEDTKSNKEEIIVNSSLLNEILEKIKHLPVKKEGNDKKPLEQKENYGGIQSTQTNTSKPSLLSFMEIYCLLNSNPYFTLGDQIEVFDGPTIIDRGAFVFEYKHHLIWADSNGYIRINKMKFPINIRKKSVL